MATNTGKPVPAGKGSLLYWSPLHTCWVFIGQLFIFNTWTPPFTLSLSACLKQAFLSVEIQENVWLCWQENSFPEGLLQSGLQPKEAPRSSRIFQSMHGWPLLGGCRLWSQTEVSSNLLCITCCLCDFGQIGYYRRPRFLRNKVRMI